MLENTPEKLLNVKEVADILNVSASFIYKLANNHDIKIVRIGEAIRFRLKDINEFILGNTTNAQ
jgi:excisionase family DNA binding protein